MVPGRVAAEPAQLPAQLAYSYGENETTRSAAMGGALRALGNGTSAVFLNPANIVQSRLYHLEGLLQITPEAGRVVGGGVIVDSLTSRLAAGISAMGGIIDPSGIDRTLLDVRVALAYPLGNRVFAGIAGRYLKANQAGNGPLGSSDVSGGLKDPDGGRFAFVNVPTFDAGLTVKLSDTFFLSAVGQSLTYPDHGLLPTTVGGGFGFGNKDLTIEVDGIADFSSWRETSGRFMVAGEYLLANHFPLRLGYRFDQGAKQHTLSGGTGYFSPEFSIEASVKRTLNGPGATTIVLGFAYFLESSSIGRSMGAEY
jgi:hypothetical protein